MRSSELIDLILTDLHMPRSDGAALIEQVRAHFPGVAVFMTSSQLPSQCVYQKLDGFFGKPLDLPEFTRFLEARYKRSGAL